MNPPFFPSSELQRKSSLKNGFTLIEAMVVVTIIGILAVLAIPSYQEYIRKGRRAEARTALTDLLQQQERYMTQRNTYLAFATGASGTPFKTHSGDNATNPHYKLGSRVCPGFGLNECVQIFATPQLEDPEAGDLQITSTGAKDCTGTKPAICWK